MVEKAKKISAMMEQMKPPVVEQMQSRLGKKTRK